MGPFFFGVFINKYKLFFFIFLAILFSYVAIGVYSGFSHGIDLVFATESFASLSMTINNVILFLSLFFIFKRKLSYLYVIITIPISILLGELTFFETHLVDYFLIPLNIMNSGSNPQAARLYLTLFVFLVLFGRNFAKDRSLSRLFVTLLLSVNIFTSFIFHVIPIKSLETEYENINNRMQKILNYSVDEFKYACKKQELLCYVIHNDRIWTFKESEYIHDVIKQHQLAEGHMLSNLKFSGISAIYYHGVKQEGEYRKGVIETEGFTKVKAYTFFTYYFHSIMAHFFWLLFTLFLIVFHESRSGLNKVKKVFNR